MLNTKQYIAKVHYLI